MGFQHEDLSSKLFLPDHLVIFNLSWEIAEKIKIWYTVPTNMRTQILEDSDNIIDGNFLKDYKDYGHNFSDSELTFEEMKEQLLNFKNDPTEYNKQLPSYVYEITEEIEIVPQLCSDESKTLVIGSQTSKLKNFQKYVFENIKQTHLQISDRGNNEKGAIERIYLLGTRSQTKNVKCPDDTFEVKDKSAVEEKIDELVKSTEPFTSLTCPNMLVLINKYKEQL